MYGARRGVSRTVGNGLGDVDAYGMHVMKVCGHISYSLGGCDFGTVDRKSRYAHVYLYEFLRMHVMHAVI